MKRHWLLFVALIIVSAIFIPAVHADFQLAGLSDGGGGKGSFLYGSTPSNLGPFLFGVCIVANMTLTPTTVTFTLGNNTLLGGQVPLYGTLQAEIFPIAWSPGTTCSTGQVAIPSFTQRIQDVVTNSFQVITFSFPNNYIVTLNSGLFVGLEVTYSSYPGVNKGIELESNSAGGQFDSNQSSCGEATGTVTGNTCNGGTTQCTFFESCNLYLLKGITPASPNVSPSVSPYGSNPPVFPCCNPVTATALQGSSLRAPDIPPDPFIWLFIIFALLTIGAYVVIRTNTTSKRNPRQYELNL
jgi:hypothetical protein